MMSSHTTMCMLCGIAFLPLSVMAAYPSTYPFDAISDEYVPFPDPLSLPKSHGDASGPNFIFVHESLSDLWDEWEDSLPDSGEQETGGYTYLMANDAGAFEDVQAIYGYDFSFISMVGFSMWKHHASLPPNALNCSAIPTYEPTPDGNMYALAAAGALGQYSEFCTPGENCCEGLNGFPLWGGATVVDSNADMGDKMLTKECAVSAMEVEFVCIGLSHVGRLICQQYILSDTERLYSIGCKDVYFVSLIQCGVYLTTDGIFNKNRPLYTDTAAYLRLLSVRELVAAYSTTRNGDHVCHPYSYYYPDFTNLSSDVLDAIPWHSTSSSSSSASSPTPPSTSSSTSSSLTSSSSTSSSSIPSSSTSAASPTQRFGWIAAAAVAIALL